MKTKPVRSLRDQHSQVLERASAAQEVSVARRIDWMQSAARRLTAAEKPLSAKRSTQLPKDGAGQW